LDLVIRSGGYYVYNPTLKRFFIFHFLFPFIACGCVLIHLFYLHFHSSNNPLRLNTNNKIPFFPYIFIKDFFGLLVIVFLYVLQSHFGISTLSHPDNALEVCCLSTPLHIVPEWYFLCQYAMLKAVPNKNAGFIVLLSSISIMFCFGEIRNLTTFIRIQDGPSALSSGLSNTNLCVYFLTFILLCWIGAQFPDSNFISYGRILSFYYYFCLSSILFTGIYFISLPKELSFHIGLFTSFHFISITIHSVFIAFLFSIFQHFLEFTSVS